MNDWPSHECPGCGSVALEECICEPASINAHGAERYSFMAYETCEDCGSRVYNLGCTWCNEEAYIEEQEYLDSLPDEYEQPTAR